jgi:hypothetical protein
MYHYDGHSWQPVRLVTAEGGLIEGPIDLSAVCGFGPNDIYAVGERIEINPNPPPNFLDSSLIIHFNGATWTEFKVVGGRMLQAVFGSAPNDIWVGGIEGTIFHFEGSKWDKVDIAHDIWLNEFGGSSANTHALGYRLDVGVEDTTWYHFLTWDGGRWNIIDSFLEVPGYTPRFGQASLALVDGELYSSGWGIFLRSSGQWQKIFEDPNGAFFRKVYGTSANSLFAVGGSGQGMVCHFNGQNWFRFSQFNFTGYHFDAVWTDGKEVFVVGSDNRQSVVLHGR